MHAWRSMSDLNLLSQKPKLASPPNSSVFSTTSCMDTPLHTSSNFDSETLEILLDFELDFDDDDDTSSDTSESIDSVNVIPAMWVAFNQHLMDAQKNLEHLMNV